jgi:hypothetical protein
MIQKEGLFSKDECFKLKQYFIEKQANVPMPTGQTRVKYKGYLLEDGEDGREYFQKLFDWFEEETGLKIYKSPKENFFLRYDVGDVFSQHTDTARDRIWIIGVQLSEETEYEGADFIFYENEEKHLVNKTIGSAFITKADVSHEVTRLNNGIRYSFVSFPDMDSLRPTKSLL